MERGLDLVKQKQIYGAITYLKVGSGHSTFIVRYRTSFRWAQTAGGGTLKLKQIIIIPHFNEKNYIEFRQESYN